LTYTVDALTVAMAGGPWSAAGLDLAVLVGFSLAFFVSATWTLARRVG